MKKFTIILFFLGLAVNLAIADVRLPKVFSDNMVLQRDMRVPIWGWADPGEKITAILGDQTAETITKPDGKWKLFLGPLDVGGPFELILSGKNKISIKNVLVGEVWVCSGQSNMAMEVRSCMNARLETAEANYPQIRLFQVKSAKSSTLLEDVSPVSDKGPAWLNKWQVCSPLTVAEFTGVGFFFGRGLWEKLHIPIGLISASWGGTTAEAWIPQDTLKSDKELSMILQNWREYNNDEEWLKSEYNAFIKEVEKAHTENRLEPLYFNQPSVLYNGIMAPVVSFGIRGVIWYQGESNAYRAYQYRNLFPALIQQWRKNWGQGNFPFLFVQLANYQFEPQVFPELRESQRMALALPETAMIVTIDIGDSSTIHPKNKQEVGRRLTLAARKLAYGQDIVYSGPLYRSMNITDGKCRLNFDHVGDGLIVKGIGPLNSFMIAGDDKHFVKAKAIIDGGLVVVWSDDVPDPVSVRYAWSNDPKDCNLYNKSGKLVYLPASPFRTDNWPGMTFNRK